MFLKRTRTTLPALVAIALLLAMLFALPGCGIGGGPRGRFGYLPYADFGDPAHLGTHSYGFDIGSEMDGTYYSLRGGTIDLGHLRGAADLTKAAYRAAYDAIIEHEPEFSVGPDMEMTTNTVALEYPPDWGTRTIAEREAVARRVALILAPAVGYQSTVWHEMLTWEGTAFALIDGPVEHESAFSWEDLYSDLLGANLSIQALERAHTDDKAYNRAMTGLINDELKRLGVVPASRAQKITRTVEGTWYKEGHILQRNMDTGFDTGRLVPCLIPGFSTDPPITYPMPTLDALSSTGFKATYSITSIYLEDGTLKRLAGRESDVQPYKDFPKIMEAIKKEAVEKYHYRIR
ncbi:MAG: DUF4056 domain-containing protein [Planctomycetes bacterium]|nr:DUF4056 domain-containing protein [Planctomycetota bacterium]